MLTALGRRGGKNSTKTTGGKNTSKEGKSRKRGLVICCREAALRIDANPKRGRRERRKKRGRLIQKILKSARQNAEQRILALPLSRG